MDTTFYFQPQRKMRKGEKCWCLSGRRWKDCHMNREQLAAVTIQQIHDAHKKCSLSVDCLHPDAPCGCSGRPIRSHSIQKNASLKAISKGSHVLASEVVSIWNMKDIKDENELIQVKKLSINKASTFPGFCGKHDTELFRPVETVGWRHSKENALLFSLRAVAMELLKKRTIVGFNKWQLDYQDRGKSFEEQVDFQLLMRSTYPAIEQGYKDISVLYEEHKKIFLEKDYSKFNYIYIELENPTPVVSCGIFAPEFDFSGKILQSYSDEKIEGLSLNIYNNKENSICIIGYIEGDKSVGSRFIDSLLSISRERISNVLMQLAFTCLENTFFNEDWYESLSENNNIIMKKMINNNSSPLSEAEAHFLMDAGWNVFDSPVTSLLDSRSEAF